MKQLTVFEMEAIAGGYNWDFSSIQSGVNSIVSNGVEALASSVLLGVTYGVGGLTLGGTQSGANGGVIGFGLIGNAIGAVWGTIVGGVAGAVLGATLGWNATLATVNEAFSGLMSGTIVLWDR